MLFLATSGIGYSQLCTTPEVDCTLGDEILNVTFAGINNDTECGDETTGYSDYTAGTPGAVTTGQTYTISVTVGDGGTEAVGVFLDFNQNQVFEANEFFNLGFNDGGTLTAQIPIPESALSGTMLMRVRNTYVGLFDDPETIYDTESPACDELSSYGEFEDYTINVTAGVGCSGTPEIGAITASDTTICGGTDLTISATVPGAFIGFSYQLEASTDAGVTWANAGATQPGGVFVINQSVPTTYRIRVTCVESGESDTSDVVSVGQNAAEGCYCTPGDENPLNCSEGDIITNVTFATINNDSDCGTNGYTNYYESLGAIELQAGEAYPISVTVGPSGEGWLDESVGVWIDYNHDGAFSEDEFTDVGTGLDETLTSSITIPTTALEGNTRMRVITSATLDEAFNSTYACNPLNPNNNFGETEDYLVNITNDLSAGDVTKGLVGLYPNPTQDILNISVKNGVQLKTAEVYNFTGQRVMSQSFESAAEGVMNVQGLAAGVYIVKLTTDQGVASERLVKK